MRFWYETHWPLPVRYPGPPLQPHPSHLIVHFDPPFSAICLACSWVNTMQAGSLPNASPWKNKIATTNTTGTIERMTASDTRAPTLWVDERSHEAEPLSFDLPLHSEGVRPGGSDTCHLRLFHVS